MENQSAILLRRLNAYCAQALEAAAILCQTRAHAEITIEHWLLKLLELGEGDITVLARRYDWDMDGVWQSLLATLDTLPRSVRSRPHLSVALLNLIKQAWLTASLDEDAQQIRSVHLLAALMAKPAQLATDGLWPLLSLSPAQLQRLRPLLDAQSDERPELQQQMELGRHPTALPPQEMETAQATDPLLAAQPPNDAHLAVLNRFTEDVTAKARENKLDPVFGRDE